MINGVKWEGLISYRKFFSGIKSSNVKLAKKHRGFESFVKTWSFECEKYLRDRLIGINFHQLTF